jgi:hypothetical protein
MENHRYGFVLDNSAVIGQQGTNTVPADNFWAGTWSTTGTPNGNFKNACLNGSRTDFSIMYTRSATNYTPHGSVYNQTFGDWAYSLSLTPITLFHISAPFFTGCPLTAAPFPANNTSNSSVLLPQETVELASSGTEEQQIVAQNQLYRIEAPTASLNSLSSLSVLQNNSNIASLWNIEKALLAGDTAFANQENTNMQAQNALEEAYQDYYRLILKHKTHTFNSTDSLRLITLAEGCPSVVGAVVYQAAVLYNMIYKTTEVFESNCATPQGRASQQESSFNEAVLSNQAVFTLYPLPNNGNFRVNGDIQEGYQMHIISTDGKKLFHAEISQETNSFQVSTNISTGVYILQISDKNDNEIWHSRIIINK